MSKDIDTLPVETLREIVAEIRELLWPREDPEGQWSPDTLASVASVLEDHGLDRIDAAAVTSSPGCISATRSMWCPHSSVTVLDTMPPHYTCTDCGFKWMGAREL